MRCDRVAAKVGSALLDGSDVDPAVSLHVDQCLRCQAEVARSSRMARSLQSLHHELVVPGSDLLPTILDTIDLDDVDGNGSGSATEGSRVRLAVTLGGLAAATAGAAAAGAIVLATRSRRLSA